MWKAEHVSNQLGDLNWLIFDAYNKIWQKIINWEKKLLKNESMILEIPNLFTQQKYSKN